MLPMAVEIAGALLALAFLLLAIAEKRTCWFACIASCILYLYVFIDAKLYVDASLQLFYIAGALYGWVRWHNRGEGLKVTSWDARIHIQLILCALGAGNALGWYLAHTTDAAYPYLDSSLAVLSILATWLQARKLLESWVYWIGIDLLYIALYLAKDLTITASLFGLYVVLACVGYARWRAIAPHPHSFSTNTKPN